jgi:hypothetical protein
MNEKTSDKPTIRVIELWPHQANCVICGQVTDCTQGIAAYEDWIVPDDYKGEWGGQHTCKDCFRIAREITEDGKGWATYAAVMSRKKR